MATKRSQIVKSLFDQRDQLTVLNEDYIKWIHQYTLLEFEKDIDKYGDITSAGVIKKDLPAKARIYAKEDGIMSGCTEIEFFLAKIDHPRLGHLDVNIKIKDGKNFKKNDYIMEINGDIKDILKIERTILNLIQHMSGIATYAKKIIDKALKINKNLLIVPTRKTTWGLLDKKAITLAGGGTHRLNLADAVLIKDNHLAINNNEIEKMIWNFQPPSAPYKFFEIEIDDPKKIIKTAKLLVEAQNEKRIKNPAIIMFDNMTPKTIEKQIGLLKKEKLYNELLFEASGGINEKNIEKYAKTGVDIISMGALTQNIKSLDLSMELVTH